jgi:mannosyltransferase
VTLINVEPNAETTTDPPLSAAPALAWRPRTQQSVDSLIVAGLVLAATLLRLPTLTRAYWVDEGISVGIASHRLSRLPALLHLDGSPPLFYAVLHFWLRAFGGSEVSTHVMALLMSLTVIPLAWWSARQFFGRPSALCAAALAATNPFLGWYATETRMYPLVCAMGIVALTLVLRAIRRRSGRDAVWAVVAFTALVYTHNWGLYLLFATAAVLAIRAVRNRDRQELTWILCGGAAVLVAYLPWLPTFLYQARHTAAPWAVRPSLGDLFADPASVLGGTLGVVIVPLFLCGIMSARSTVRTIQTSLVLIFFAIGALTVTEGWVAAQLKPSWASRYLAVGLAPLLVAVAGALGSSKRGRRVILAASVMLGTWSLVGSLLPDPNAHFAKSNVASVVAVARPLLTPGDLVLVTQSEQLAVVAHYLPAGLQFATPTGPVSDPYVVDWRNLIERLATADPCVTVAPELESLPAGAHVLVINPFEPVGASGTRWSFAVNRQVLQVNELLLNDPGLQLDGNFSPATSPEPFSPVSGLLFTKGQGSAPCP